MLTNGSVLYCAETVSNVDSLFQIYAELLRFSGPVFYFDKAPQKFIGLSFDQLQALVHVRCSLECMRAAFIRHLNVVLECMRLRFGQRE